MRAVVVREFGLPPTVEDVLEPECAPDGVVIEVLATGLCRSDWHGWRGHDPDIRLPHVPGHEFAGRIVEKGSGVTRFAIGQRVTAPFVLACGACEQCRHGEQQVCTRQTQPGFTYWGSFAELVAVAPADVNLVAVPDGMDVDVAAGLGCRFATAYRAVTVHGRPRPDDKVVVFGAGGVGLSVVMIALARGAQVIVVDPSPRARELAAGAGAHDVIDAHTNDLSARLRDATDGGAHISFDAIGSATAVQHGVLALRPRGRYVQIGLLPDTGNETPVPMAFAIANEIEIYGSHGMPAWAYEQMLAEIAAGDLRPGALVHERIALVDAPAALAAMDRRSPAGITVIHPHPSQVESRFI